MRRFIVRFFATIGAIVFVVVLAVIGIAVWARLSGPEIADNTVLTIDIGAGFPDAPPQSPLARLLVPGRPTLRDVLDALTRAADDPRVKGLIARVGDGEMGLAEAQELRDAILAFRAKGKRAIAYADSFGELGGGTRSYYLASAFGQIWLQPLGEVGLDGLRIEEPFVRGTLDKIGVEPVFDAREQYKTAADPLTQTTMTAPDREQLQALLDSVYGQIVSGIATDRKVEPATVRALIDHGPLLAKEALAAHLIDHVGYSDEARAALGVAPGAKAQPMPLMQYLKAAGRPDTHGPTIALIYASGLITGGRSENNPLTGSATLGARSIIAAFRAAERDPAVKAILFRIDSPGGSAVASESIWRETMRAKAAGKKLIVSMGDVAGSGGYYIAAAADKIVAEPATLTGSIGVVAGKVVLSGLLRKIGASTSAVSVGADSDISSPFEDFTPAGRERFEAFLDEVYAGFKARVAEGRKLDVAQVEKVAKGRVWSGADAKAHGLVDVLGGYETALALAKHEAGIPASSPVTVEVFPRPESTAHLLFARVFGDDDVAVGTARALARTLTALGPWIGLAERLTAPPGTLVMAPIEID